MYTFSKTLTSICQTTARPKQADLDIKVFFSFASVEISKLIF